MEPVHRADPELVRKVRLWLLPAGAVALLLAAALTAVSNHGAARGSPTLLYAALVVLIAVGVAALRPIGYLWAIGRDAAAENRYPPLRARVLHDTRVYAGEAARLRGRILRALAATLALFAIGTPVAVAWLVLTVA